MTSYTPNIPQPNDDPSDSQDQLLQNFQTLNNLYGINGDHYPWTNQTATEGTRHAKVTLPGLPTTNSPGNIVPVPAINEGVLFSLTAGTQTFPFWRRDAGALNYPVVAWRAFCRTIGNVIIGNAFNIISASQAPAGTWTFTLANPEPDPNYLVLASVYQRLSGNPTLSVQSISNATFVVSVFGGVANGLTVSALRYTL